MQIKNILRTSLLLGVGLLFVACQQAPKKAVDYAIVQGHIDNPIKGKPFRLFNPETAKSILIEVNEKGEFKDTLRLENPTYFNVAYNKIFQVYISNGMDITINFNSKDLKKSLSYKGEGSQENSYLRYKTSFISNFFKEGYRKFLVLKENVYNEKIQTLRQKLGKKLEENQTKFDSAFIASEHKRIDQFITDVNQQREIQLAMNENVGKGKPSPLFKDYINYEGGTSSLKDYRGSYVYIDVWATWCKPCLYQLPYLKKIEEQYKGKDITFISLSVDDPEDEARWRKMIKEKSLAEGNSIQLLADNAIKSTFIQDYYIQGIPRFILLDPQGNIISNNAPRPTDPKLIELFNKLNL